MTKLLDNLKEINKASLLPKDYKANNVIFRVAILLIAIFLIFVAYDMPQDKAYFKCVNLENHPVFNSPNLPCDNPFYLASPCPFADAQQCTQKVVAVGSELGRQPSKWYDLAFPISLLILGSAVALNHFLYNRRWRQQK